MKTTNCNLCARNCNVNRKIHYGFCKSNNNIKIARIMLHHWEEPCISGTNGSGAIFFSNCNLNCVYCQNYKISQEGKGSQVSINKLAEIFKDLENKGAHNINLVTPTHYTNEIIEALKIYKPNIPIIWNTNSYENKETLNLLKNYVDIFLFDLKYFDNNLSHSLSNTRNYFEIASKNILYAKSFIPNNIYKENILQKGIIIRHLILPNQTNDSIKILNWIKDNYPTATISLMSQYTPYYKAKEIPELNRKITKLEYKRVLVHAQNLKLNGFMQDTTSATETYIPNF